MRKRSTRLVLGGSHTVEHYATAESTLHQRQGIAPRLLYFHSWMLIGNERHRQSIVVPRSCSSAAAYIVDDRIVEVIPEVFEEQALT